MPKSLFSIIQIIGALSIASGMIGSAMAETLSTGGVALNTNNNFVKLDGNPIIVGYPLSNSDPDQQWDRQSGNYGTLLRNRTTGKCLNARYLSNGGRVNQWPCNPSDIDQNFIITGSGVVSLKRANTNFCIDLPNRATNTSVQLWTCMAGNSNQSFTVNAGSVPTGDANTPYLPWDPGVTMQVTQGYNGSTSHYDQYNTNAVDFAPLNTNPVSARAVRAGTVVVSTNVNDGYGNRVIIRYNDGMYGMYAHLASLYVSVGAVVVGGQGLGQIGTTGRSTGVHLHYAEGRRIENSYAMERTTLNFVDAPGANFNKSNFNLVSRNPDNRR